MVSEDVLEKFFDVFVLVLGGCFGSFRRVAGNGGLQRFGVVGTRKVVV